MRRSASDPVAPEPRRPRLGAVFTWLWLGQTISVLGSGLTTFALGVWVYQRTGSVNRFALVALSGAAPAILLAPLLGTVIDRCDRRRVLIASDCGAGLSTLGLALAVSSGGRTLWLLCLLAAGYGTCAAVTSLALAASVPLLVPDLLLGRANGMAQFSSSLAPLLGPLLGGVLLGVVGLLGILMIDFATFGASIGILLWLRLPRLPRPAPDRGLPHATGGLLREAALGWTFVRSRSGLLGLLAISALANLAFILVEVLINPLVLSFASSAALGLVLFTAGLGMVGGGLLMAAWGGPRRRVLLLLWLLALQGAVLLLGGARASLWWIAAAGFFFLAGQAIMAACSQSVWQRKIPPHLAARVLAVRLTLASSTLPAGYLLAGPLADRVFEPLMTPGGALAASLGPLVGVGRGRGIGLFLMVLGVTLLAAAAAAGRIPAIRDVERLLPDALADPV